VAGITLDDKRVLTSFLSRAGANIRQLNTVRKQLSRIKGGGLLRVCRAGRLITLIISDVLGDPLDVIASGPTVPDSSTAADALQVLRQFGAEAAGISPAIFDVLRARAATSPTSDALSACPVANHVIGNLALAVDAAGQEAERRGYSHAMVAARDLEGEANGVGAHLSAVARRMQCQRGPDCLISGGEPTVTLCTTQPPGRGGRNQQVVLAALCALLADTSPAQCHHALEGILVLSGGTDGEDGPTDAAGAMADAAVAAAAIQRQLDPSDYLARNDAYPFFAATGGLLQTGPTHTNVCDLRVVLVDRRELAAAP
jgi:glycerate-2-kinase